MGIFDQFASGDIGGGIQGISDLAFKMDNPERFAARKALEQQQQSQQQLRGLFSDPANAGIPIEQLVRKASAIDPAYAKQLIELEMARALANQKATMPNFKIQEVGGSLVRINENDPYSQPEVLIKAPPKALSPTEQKELFETTDKISSGENTISSIKRAQELVSGVDKTTGAKIAKPFSGFGAETWAAANRVPLLGALIPDARATATTDLANITSTQALESMKSIFGANPTEGERQILLKLQALPSYTQKEQATILENAYKAAERRVAQQRQRAKAIEGRDYGNLAGQPATSASNASPIVRYNAAGQKATLINGKWVIE